MGGAADDCGWKRWIGNYRFWETDRKEGLCVWCFPSVVALIWDKATHVTSLCVHV